MSWRVFGRQADSYRLALEFGQAGASDDGSAHIRLTSPIATLEVTWDDSEAETAVVERLTQKLSMLGEGRGEERLHVMLFVAQTPPGASPRINLGLQHKLAAPALRCITVSRNTSSGTASESLLRLLLQQCQLDGVWKLKGAEGFGNFWATCTDPSLLTSMRNLNLSYCSLATLPPSIGCLTALRILRLSHNKLTTLPGELGQLTMLEVLAVDANLLTSVPVEVRRCVALKELNLEGNRIATPVLDLRPMRNTLQSLQLYGNPLEYLPELSPCSQLRSLSLANVRIMADATYTRWEVEVGALPYMARGHKLAPLFRLTFRRASLQHPLLAGALGRIAEERAHCELISKEETALQQLSLMALSDNYVVVRQACKVLGHLAACGVATVNKLMSHDVASAVHTLVMSPLQDSQLCGLSLMSDLASSSDSVSADLLTDPVLERLHELICKGDPSVRQAALQCLSSLLYCAANRRAVLAAPGLLGSVAVLAQAPSGTAASMMARNGSRSLLHGPVAGGHKLTGPQRSEDAATGAIPTLPGSTHLGYASGSTRLSALRVLAVLGENDCVQDALNMPRITRRGVRVLSLDGGGMKGITIVQMLRAIQARLPKPLHTYWDLVVGTSTGAIIAVSIAMLQMHLDAVEAVYTELGQKVFNAARVAGNEETAASWRDSLYRVYRSSSQHVRVAVYGSKHDPSAFETLVKDFADMKKRGCLSDQLIDTAGLPGIPKVALVSTLTSITPAQPFLFRTYELPSGMETMAAHIAACEGSSRHPVWQAVRASASAPYYLDDFQCGEDRFQDGATTANNPSLIALQQARLLWPNLPVECLVSLGCGCPAPARRERSVSSYLDTGSVLIESACSTDRVHEALATTLPLLPNTHYFRFQPVDERFAVELDDVSPASIVKLQAAASEYCVSHSARFDSLAELLLSTHDVEDEDEAMDAAGGVQASEGGEDVLSPRSGTVLKLGRRRGLLVLHAPREVLLPAAATPPGLQDATVAALSSLPQLLRITDLTTTCSPVAQPATPAAASEQSPSSHSQPVASGQSRSPFDQRGPRQQSFGFTFDPRHSPPPGNTPSAVQQARRPHDSHAQSPRQTGITHEGQIPPLALAAVAAGTAAGTVVDGPQAKLSISTTIGFHPTAKPLSSVATTPTGATAIAKPAAAEGDVPITSPTQDASSTVSSSIFNYFMPRWGVTSPQATDSATPASTKASPQAQPAQVELAATQSQSATTAPVVQVLVPSHSSPQAATTPTASSSVTAAVAANAGMEQATGGRPSAGGVGQSQGGGSVWFPWSSSAGPSSPVISPVASVSRAPQTFSPTHASTSATGSLGASQSQQGAYLFRSRSKTDSGPAPIAPGTATHNSAGDNVQPPFRDGSAGGLHGSMSDPHLNDTTKVLHPLQQYHSAAVPATADVAAVAPGGDLAASISRGSSPSQSPYHLHHTSSLQSHPLLEPSSGTVQVSLPSFSSMGVQGEATTGPHAPMQPQQPLCAAPSLQHLHRWSVGGGSPQNPRPQAQLGGSPGEPRTSLPATVEAAVHAGLIHSPTSHTQAGAHRSTAHATGGIPRPRAVISGLLEDLAEQGLGVVHLALEPDSAGGRGEGGGLITQWTSEVVSIMEPGPQAAHVVHQLGGAPGATLGEVTGGAVTFLVGLARYTRLSMQEVTTPGGILVRNMLYSVSHPCQMLTAGDVAAAGVEWASLMVTASCAMPKPLVEAFLRAGVRALVCLGQEPSSPQQQAALPTVFQQLLLNLNSGMPVEDAIKTAEAQDEGICEGLLIIHHA